jgi:hypothetical protein
MIGAIHSSVSFPTNPRLGTIAPAGKTSDTIDTAQYRRAMPTYAS